MFIISDKKQLSMNAGVQAGTHQADQKEKKLSREQVPRVQRRRGQHGRRCAEEVGKGLKAKPRSLDLI